jgi:predicted DsbA family dithiol-disulfide isomerase
VSAAPVADGSLQVDIWSDIACPWCAIGKRHLEQALADWEHRDDVVVTWHSFELDPRAPAEREGDLAERLADKYGVTVEEARASQERITGIASKAGLEFRFDRARSGNTFDAHRLVHLAAVHGKAGEMKERLFRAYLEEGELVSDHEVLARLAEELGLPEAEVAEVLATERFAEEVRLDESTAHALRISGVPFFVFDRKYGAAGAQPPDVLRQVLDRAWSERSPVEVVADGEACGPDGC